MNRLALLTALCLIACDRAVYSPDKPIEFKNTLLLAHAGGGWFDQGNTIEACRYGLAALDGIECDIQRSSDNDLWLSHSGFITPCDSSRALPFPTVTSSTILQIDSCLGALTNFTRLDSVFSYMQANYPDKPISLDVKAWTPTELSGLNIITEMNELGQKIITLATRYHLENNVMVESESGDFLYYIRTHSPTIQTYLTTFGDFELGVSKALYGKFTGISFKYKFKETLTKEKIDLIHLKGLKIHLWTVNTEIDMEEALLLGVDYIQTDNVEGFRNPTAQTPASTSH